MSKEQILYTSEITDLGEKVPELLEGKMFIPFADFAPDELKPICVCHTHLKAPHFKFRENDYVRVGEQCMLIKEVGTCCQSAEKECDTNYIE